MVDPGLFIFGDLSVMDKPVVHNVPPELAARPIRRRLCGKPLLKDFDERGFVLRYHHHLFFHEAWIVGQLGTPSSVQRARK
jgi:hypothetical protein